MKTQHLQDLLHQLKIQQGGFVLNSNDKPEAVVLTIDRYNQLINQAMEMPITTHPKTVLITGIAGYIGAHIARLLIKEGHKVIGVDNLSTGVKSNIDPQAIFVEADLSDEVAIDKIFELHNIDIVVHAGASIEVEESVQKPLEYLNNNAINTKKLLDLMLKHSVDKIIFSSTAAVYGDQTAMPISEDAGLGPVDPYGHSKLIAEQIIQYYTKHKSLRSVIFRYFNACGTDFDQTIFSSHESHIIPRLIEVVNGKSKEITVYGNDWPTNDGTAVRDYVHVLDIARAHKYAINHLIQNGSPEVLNIGTSHGTSVQELITATAEITNHMIPMTIGPRRPGDWASAVADNTKIKKVLNFELKYSDLETIIKTSWRK